MGFVILALLVTFSLDWATSCKPVKYEYKQAGATFYGWGAKKGCASDVNPQSQSRVQAPEFNVSECSSIKNGGIFLGMPLILVDDEYLESLCNSYTTCVWKSGKCKAESCPGIVDREKCWANNLEFKNGKCVKLKKNECKMETSIYIPTPQNRDCDSFGRLPDGSYGYEYDCNRNHNGSCSYETTYSGLVTYYCSIQVPEPDNPYSYTTPNTPCSQLPDYYQRTYHRDNDSYTFQKYTSGDEKACTYQCTHLFWEYSYSGPYQYTIERRKYCHRQLGCLYANNTGGACSSWSVWAFVLTLVVLILLVVGGGVGVFVVVAHFVLKLF